ncbi:MAG: hypothetical protein HY509_04380, partial [Acidobacteria bacterium]|nr:hypothetical protein [Acidobacteriota bacterium]
MRAASKKNLGLKLLSLFLATLLWVVLAGEGEQVRDFSLPLQWINVPSSLEITGDAVDTVLNHQRAPEAILRSVTADRLAARLDLRDAPPGTVPFQLTPAIVRHPSGTQVLSVEPEIVELQLEPKREREIPVIPVVEGTPAAGFEIAGVSVSPETIRIEGPETEVLATEAATTGRILLRGDETEAREFSVHPVPRTPPGSRVRVVDRSPATVRVDIREPTERRTFPGIPVGGDGGPFRFRIAPERLQVVLEGPGSLIRRLRPEDLLVEI